VHLLRTWFNIAAIVLCFCLLFNLVALAEEPQETPEEEPEVDSMVIDFTFCIKSVDKEQYAQLETDVSIKELSCLQFRYLDADRAEQESEIIVNSAIAFDALYALEDIFEAQLPIWEIEYCAIDSYDVIFRTVPGDPDPEHDPYNSIFKLYGFIWNENQAEGWRHYTYIGYDQL